MHLLKAFVLVRDAFMDFRAFDVFRKLVPADVLVIS